MKGVYRGYRIMMEYGDLRDKLKSLHPVSESTTTSEPINLSDENVLTQILEELKKIRKNTER